MLTGQTRRVGTLLSFSCRLARLCIDSWGFMDTFKVTPSLSSLQEQPGFFLTWIQIALQGAPRHMLRSWTAGLSLAFAPGSCVTLSKLLQLSVPQCPHL